MQRKKAEIEGRDKDEFCSDLYIQQGQKSIKCIDIIKIINIVILDFCVDVTRSEFWKFSLNFCLDLDEEFIKISIFF